jgi:outer membrane protein insertion porin family
VLTPFPGAGNDRSLRVFGFVDIGKVYAENEKFSIPDLRASAGIGLSWLSPIGPLRVAFAKPLRTQPGDRIQKLQFQIGTSF